MHTVYSMLVPHLTFWRKPRLYMPFIYSILLCTARVMLILFSLFVKTFVSDSHVHRRRVVYAGKAQAPFPVFIGHCEIFIYDHFSTPIFSNLILAPLLPTTPRFVYHQTPMHTSHTATRTNLRSIRYKMASSHAVNYYSITKPYALYTNFWHFEISRVFNRELNRTNRLVQSRS